MRVAEWATSSHSVWGILKHSQKYWPDWHIFVGSTIDMLSIHCFFAISCEAAEPENNRRIIVTKNKLNISISTVNFFGFFISSHFKYFCYIGHLHKLSTPTQIIEVKVRFKPSIEFKWRKMFLFCWSSCSLGGFPLSGASEPPPWIDSSAKAVWADRVPEPSWFRVEAEGPVGTRTGGKST